VLRHETLPIAMETFSAGEPASECVRMAAEADGVICVVAHRCGYIPPPELGSDGIRSITWLEVDAARHVFPFIVDPKAPWTDVKEQDRLVSEPGKLAEIAHAVKKQQDFKTYLQRRYKVQNFTDPVQNFTDPEHLAELVAIMLANFATQPCYRSASGILSSAMPSNPRSISAAARHGSSS
jgi:hypothetical protein